MKRIRGLDGVRALSTLGIVAFHFYSHSHSARKLFFAYANGTWGDTLVYVFLMLSGASLWCRNGGKRISVRQFYFKRWKSLMPPFYLVFAYTFFIRAIEAGRLFFLSPHVRPASLILSALGMDGYFYYRAPNYYYVGEWFLGAILFLYIAYPLVHRCFTRAKWPVYGALALAFVAVPRLIRFQIPFSHNLITCGFAFVTGMVLFDSVDRIRDVRVLMAAALAALLLLVYPVPFARDILAFGMGVCVFIIAFHIGERARGRVYAAVRKVSELSYPVYLIHHVLILKSLETLDSASTAASLQVLLVDCVLIFVFAKVLLIVMDSVYQSALFQRLEASFGRIEAASDAIDWDDIAQTKGKFQK